MTIKVNATSSRKDKASDISACCTEAHAPRRGQGTEEQLFEEFSETLDKIAAHLARNYGPLADFGLSTEAASVQTAVAAAAAMRTQTTEPRPIEQPRAEGAEAESLEVSDAAPVIPVIEREQHEEAPLANQHGDQEPVKTEVTSENGQDVEQASQPESSAAPAQGQEQVEAQTVNEILALQQPSSEPSVAVQETAVQQEQPETTASAVLEVPSEVIAETDQAPEEALPESPQVTPAAEEVAPQATAVNEAAAEGSEVVEAVETVQAPVEPLEITAPNSGEAKNEVVQAQSPEKPVQEEAPITVAELEPGETPLENIEQPAVDRKEIGAAHHAVKSHEANHAAAAAINAAGPVEGSAPKGLLQAMTKAAPAALDVLSAVAQRLSAPSASQHAVPSAAAIKAAAPAADPSQLTAPRPFAAGNFDPRPRAERQSEAPRAVPRPLLLKNLEKVEAVLKEAARGRDGKTISLRLDPPELGRVKVDVTLREGNLHARLVAESPQVSLLLRERAHDLHAMLRKMGMNVDRVTVSVVNENLDSGVNARLNERDGTRRGQENPAAAGNGLPSQGGGVAAALGQRKEQIQVLDHWVA